MEQKAQLLIQFGANVRGRRQAMGLSQEALAASCGLDRTYISGIERGKRNVSLINISVIANALEVSISDLMEGVGS